MKKILILIALLNVVLFADSDGFWGKSSKRGVAPDTNQLYINECGACHFPYQPGLLPANAWTKMMKNLEQHFDTDATLAPEDHNIILKYLNDNSAEKNMDYKRSRKIVNSLRSNVIPDSISETPYIIDKHDKINQRLITQDEVKGLFNCKACHTTAETGSYSDDDVRIPNYGRWDD